MTWLKLTEEALFLMEGGTNQFLDKIPVEAKKDNSGAPVPNEFTLDIAKEWFTRDASLVPGTMAIDWKTGRTAPTPFPNKVLTLGTVTSKFTVNVVSQVFFDAPLSNIQKYLPKVLHYLEVVGLGDEEMTLMALATIRAETAGFEPISEFISRFNTSSGGHPFDLYDFRSDLGNNGVGEGARFKGRGFIQLTGRFNYEKYDKQLGLDGRLLSVPDLANDPDVAARILAQFLKDAETRIRNALQVRDFREARKAVNGGTHGLAQFIKAYTTGEVLV